MPFEPISQRVPRQAEPLGGPRDVSAARLERVQQARALDVSAPEAPVLGDAGVSSSASGDTTDESVNSAARSITLASWRTFPGQANVLSVARASGVSVLRARP